MAVCRWLRLVFLIAAVGFVGLVVTIASSEPAKASSTDFVSTWRVDDTRKLRLPLSNEGPYDFFVYWGDGTSDYILSAGQPEATHTYRTAGTYTITISGTFRGWFVAPQDRDNLLNIAQWGDINLGNRGGYFAGCGDLTVTATDSPDLTGTTDMSNAFADAAKFNGSLAGWNMSNVTNVSGMFSGASAFNQPIGTWNTSNVTNMSEMFKEATAFNQNISTWDTSNVTNMSSMFAGIPVESSAGTMAFNQNISTWNTSNVTNMSGMFYRAASFNQDISTWNTSNVTNMSEMFFQAASFNQDINTWNTSNVTDMSKMFAGSPYTNAGTMAFNQPLDAWDTSNVTNMSGMFNESTSFNQNINTWDTSNVTNMSKMFAGSPSSSAGTMAFNQPLDAWDTSNVTTMSTMFYRAFAFNHDISTWNTSKVTDMSKMFAGNPYTSAGTMAFNQPIGTWDTSNVTNMSEMFKEATAFNQNISTWNTSKVTNMSDMFYEATAFNQNISTWNTSKVTNMDFMFASASSFNQPVGEWDTSSVTDMTEMFSGAVAFDQDVGRWNIGNVAKMSGIFSFSGLTTANYDRALMGWATLPRVRTNVELGALSIRSSCTAEAARQLLITKYTWRILDGGSPGYCFVSTWDTTKTSSDSSSDTQVRLPLESSGTYDFDVDWESDGVIDDVITSYGQAEVTHDYGEPGLYTITISGPLKGWRFNNSGDRNKLLEISQWGDINLGNGGNYFEGCTNLTSTASDSPDLQGTTNFSRMFANAPNFDGQIGGWDTSGVTQMDYMLSGASSFNQPLGEWDTSQVTTMASMFSGASSFNQPIGDWNTSNVKHMYAMFSGASSFNQPIGDWNTANVETVGPMFSRASSFNQPIGDWNTAKVWRMDAMFQFASSFDQPIGQWNTSTVNTMSHMFFGAASFNQPIGGWDVSKVGSMELMFSGASSFNQPIGGWNTSKVQSMRQMFLGASSFDQDIRHWNTSMLYQIAQMFEGASAFDQEIGDWHVGNISTMYGIFDDSGMSPRNYGATLMGWAGQSTLITNVDVGARGIKYSCPAESSRQHLIDAHAWRIQDGGSAPCLEASPASWGFGDVRTGTNASKTFTVSNTGTAALTVSTLQLTGTDPDSYTITTQSCTSAPIAPAATCSVTARFNPTETGTKNAGLTFTYDAPGSPVTIDLTGNGTAPAFEVSEPPSAPTTPSKQQKPGNPAAKPPKRLRARGTTVIAGPNARTNAGQSVRTRVTVRSTRQNGDPAARVVRRKDGSVLVRATDLTGVKVVVRQSAPATGEYLEYEKRTVYINGRLR